MNRFVVLLPLICGAKTLDPSSAALQYVGRWDLSNRSQPQFQWPGSSISFQLQCSETSTILANFTSNDAWIKLGVYLGSGTGKEQHISTTLAEKTAAVQAVIPAGTWRISIVKIAEDFNGNPTLGGNMDLPPSTFLGMEYNSEICKLSPAPPKERKMQIIGDSITCGFGNDVNPRDLKAKAECASGMISGAVAHNMSEHVYNLTNTHEAYSMQLARRFNADVQIQCISGIGLCKNAGQIPSHTDENISLFVDRVLPYSTGAPWDYAIQPDLLVVNIGTNDYDSSAGPMAPSKTEFIAAYLRLVHHVMSYYSSATKIVLVCGPMQNRFCPSVVQVASDLRTAGFSAEYVAASLPNSPLGLGGCMYHPDVAEDTAVVDLILPVVQNLTGWEPVA
jgi:hypothetical protein